MSRKPASVTAAANVSGRRMTAAMRPGFTVDDIHELREYNHERTKDLTSEEKTTLLQ